MTSNRIINVSLVALAITFTIALYYLTVQATNVLNFFLRPLFPGVEFFTVPWNMLEYVGIACLVGIICVIVLGCLLKKPFLSKMGSLSIFMPVFGHFFSEMFLLVGVQVLQVVLLPISRYLNIVKLEPLLVGAEALLWVCSQGFIVVGLSIFSWGVFSWLKGVVTRQKVFSISIYRYSRHPQYLGYILWSFGIYLQTLIPCGGPFGYVWFNYFFPWFLSVLSMVGIALYEEIGMANKYPEEYSTYRREVSFLVPVPHKIKKAFMFPVRAISKKDYPERGREILLLLALYGGMGVLLVWILSYVIIGLAVGAAIVGVLVITWMYRRRRQRHQV